MSPLHAVRLLRRGYPDELTAPSDPRQERVKREFPAAVGRAVLLSQDSKSLHAPPCTARLNTKVWPIEANESRDTDIMRPSRCYAGGEAAVFQ